MKNYFNNIFVSNKKWRKEGLLCFLLAIGLFVACEGALEDGNPFGPSNSSIVINPSSPQVNKGGTLTFAAFGGTLPLSWSLSNTQIGAIDAGTGVFTSIQAGGIQVAGTSTVTVVDAVGDTDTATIQVLPNPLTIDPGSSTQSVAGSVTFDATNGSGNVVATIANNSSTSTFTLPAVTVAANIVTVTFAKPSTAEGNQTLTISITDTQNGDVGSVVLTLLA
ncbi:MAG: hypothetical protein H8E32_15425 [Nitrospinae bacterium]|nr:hypothetical protein [Nitrospinota bacterium]